MRLAVFTALRSRVSLLGGVRHLSVFPRAPDVKGVYERLVQHNKSAAPVECNFISRVVDVLAQSKNRPAITSLDLDTGQKQNISYAELTAKSKAVAGYFESKGICKGDAVVLMLGQRASWWYSLAALMRAGIVVVPCPRLLTEGDLKYRINDLNIRGIITSADKADLVHAVSKQCPSLVSLVLDSGSHSHFDSIGDALTSHPGSQKAKTTTNDACFALYTSGTTGFPKAVIHNHDYPFFHYRTGAWWMKATEEDVIYNASDTGWGFTAWTTLGAWSMGSQILITPTNQKFDAQKILSVLQNEGVTIFCAAPTVLRLLVAQPNFDSYRFLKLKRIVTVGEALDEIIIQKFESMGVDVHVGFGQAETTLLLGRVNEQIHVSGTMGRPVEPYKIEILDDDLQPLTSGVGQIAVDLKEGCCNGLLRYYANAPERTTNAFSDDGRYYLTGDWAEKLPSSLFVYQGRKDDLIKSRGYRIGPDEVEKAGMSHPAVAKIAVVGVQDEATLGVTVKAYILLKPDYVESPELICAIQRHIRAETAPHKYPRLVECLSREEWEQHETISGKIRRAGLRARESEAPGLQFRR